jgi:light-regulated signal transduction histidine kinase (bacteriophytochrome)
VEYRGKTIEELAEFSSFFRDAMMVCKASDEKAWQQKGLSRCEEIIPMPGGGVRVFDVIKVPLFSPDGARKALSMVGRDITERKEAERQLIEVNLELEKRVERRSSQLKAANEELESFSYSIAHNLKGPLRRVQIMLEMLEKELSPELANQLRSFLVSVSRSVSQMTSLVEGLLALSLNGRRPLQPEPISLSELAKEVVAELSAEADARVIDWRIGTLPKVSCDRVMLKQVLLNYLGNAVKYTRRVESPSIEVFYSLEGKEHVIGVRDNGAGFRMEYADKLFVAFQRLHRAEDFEGTGIGLSMVKRIILRHGGRVWAEGVPCRGASFYFTLPAL